MNTSEDTIAAIATATGEGGISIVRVSGAQSLALADRIFRCRGSHPSQRKGGTFVHGHVIGPPSDGSGSATVIDEALLLIFKAPRSYTREDVVEIHGHGGPVSAQRILRRVLGSGARPAEPGEFTKRAFLNGRLDLTQAEAVLDLVRASSDRAAIAAMEQLNGSLTEWCVRTYSLLIALISSLEASLDFPDDEMPPLVVEESRHVAELVRNEMMAMLATWDEGHILRDGALTVISGKPNVGKSTLFNSLLGRDRAIVADQPGTTRDTIEENMVLNGVLLRLVDTAGLRETECSIEHQGVMRARSQIERADLQIHVLDASQQFDDACRAELESLPSDRTIIVLNKVDLGISIKPSDIAKYTAISACLLKKEDVDNLKTTLASKLAKYTEAPVRVAISERHRQVISVATNNVEEAIHLLLRDEERVLAVAASLLRSAAEHLATLTGSVYYDDLLDKVFSRFCVGK